MPPDTVSDLGLNTFDGEDGRDEDQDEEVPDAEGPSGRRARDPYQPEGREAAPPPTVPFVLSEALPVVPARLVRKIGRGEFVDMSELLKDNMELERRRAACGGEPSQGHLAGRTGRREVPDVMSWLHSFSLYAAIMWERHPQKVKEMWAYQATMIAEARRCGGRGWLLYDSAFRQQAAASTSMDKVDFSRINQSLYATTFLAYGGRGQFCTTCMQPDHTAEECALHPSRALPVVRVSEEPTERRSRPVEARRGKSAGKRPCFGWNDGQCSYQYCKYDHVCARCHGNHRREACRNRGEANRERGREDSGNNKK